MKTGSVQRSSPPTVRDWPLPATTEHFGIWDTQDLDRPLLVKRQPEAIIHLAFSPQRITGRDRWLRFMVAYL